jgi:hypothetical protein
LLLAQGSKHDACALRATAERAVGGVPQASIARRRLACVGSADIERGVPDGQSLALSELLAQVVGSSNHVVLTITSMGRGS